jgi:hypothetical protein
VAVVAVFRQLGVPERLLTLVEGESLLNDGVAIVLFTDPAQRRARAEASVGSASSSSSRSSSGEPRSARCSGSAPRCSSRGWTATSRRR